MKEEKKWNKTKEENTIDFMYPVQIEVFTIWLFTQNVCWPLFKSSTSQHNFLIAEMIYRSALCDMVATTYMCYLSNENVVNTTEVNF